jgi:glycosyltransferase involved in cell wall biosynthesis
MRVSAAVRELEVGAVALEGKRDFVGRAHSAVQPEAGERITMLLENCSYPDDVRVRHEAESLVAGGHQVEVIAPRANGQPRREQLRGVDVRRFRRGGGGRQGTAQLVVEYASATLALHAAAIRSFVRGSSVLHLHNPPDTLFLAGALFRLARRRVVFDHHDLAPELVAVRFGSGALLNMARISERLTFAVASHVLAANESHADIARSRGNKRRDEVTIVRNGPPEIWTRMPLQSRPGRVQPVRLAYVGTVAEQDGVHGLAEVLARLRDRAPPVAAELTVIGDGDARLRLEGDLQRWGVAGSVTITGWVAPERVPVMLQQADICVDPAPHNELNERSTMIKLAEYLALGKPVVAYDLLETRRTVRDAALLVPPGDARAFAERIATLAADPALRRRLGQRARARAAELTWDKSESELLAAYAGLGRRTAARGHA